MSTPEIDRYRTVTRTMAWESINGYGSCEKAARFIFVSAYCDLDGKPKQFTRKLHTNHLPTARRIRDTHFAPVT